MGNGERCKRLANAPEWPSNITNGLRNAYENWQQMTAFAKFAEIWETLLNW